MTVERNGEVGLKPWGSEEWNLLTVFTAVGDNEFRGFEITSL